MNLISGIKNNKTLQREYDVFRKIFFCFLTMISPELNTKFRYKSVFGKNINLQSPQNFSEKLLWLKLNKYIGDPLVAKCADKYRVREYIEECGCSQILNTLYGVYDNPQDIQWDCLPKSFVLKWNFGAGMNIVCKDKTKIDLVSTMKQLEKWGKVKYWLPYSEMQYKNTEKKIICERYLEDCDNPDVIPDYKVYCFHGEPKAIFVIHDRGQGIKSEFFDTAWNKLENTNKYSNVEHMTPKPECLDELLEVSRLLSKPFPFVRCDYYIVNGKLFFGELTFTPAGGLYMSTTKIGEKDLSTFLHVPC